LMFLKMRQPDRWSATTRIVEKKALASRWAANEFPTPRIIRLRKFITNSDCASPTTKRGRRLTTIELEVGDGQVPH
jgi:hypothetical protein